MSEPTVKSQNRLKIYKRAALIGTLLAMAVSAIAFALGAKEDSRYLAHSFTTYLLYALTAVAILSAIPSIFLFKGHGVRVIENRPATFIPILTCFGVVSIYIPLVPSISGDGFSLTDWSIIALSVFVIIYALSGLLRLSKGFTLFSGYAQIFFCLLLIGVTYLDLKVEMNAPLKPLVQFSLAAITLSTLSDIRVLISRSHAGLFIFSKLCSIILSTIAAIGALVSFIVNPYNYPLIYLSLSIFSLSCGATALSRLFYSVLTEKEDNEPKDESGRLSAKEIIEEIIEEPTDNGVSEDDN